MIKLWGFVTLMPALPKPSHLCPARTFPTCAFCQTFVDKAWHKHLSRLRKTFCRKYPKKIVYIRVEETNEAAIAMYQRMGYRVERTEDPVKKGQPKIIVLSKYLAASENEAVFPGEAGGYDVDYDT